MCEPTFWLFPELKMLRDNTMIREQLHSEKKKAMSHN